MEEKAQTKKPGRIDLKAAIKNAHPAPQGTLEEIEAKAAPKKGRNAPRKAPEDKIAQKIVVGFTQSEVDAIMEKAKELSKSIPGGIVPATSLVVKMATLEYIKK